MFEQSLRVGHRRRRMGRALAAAVAMHGAGAGALLVAGLWTVPAVAAPPTPTILIDFSAHPPVASGLPEAAPEAAPQPEPEPLPIEPPVTQPEQVPEEVPAAAPPEAAPLAPPPSLAPVLPAGGSGRGARGGVPWGDPNAPAGPPGRGGDGDAPIELDARMVPPAVIHRVTPVYTEPARRSRTQGIVIVEATIDRTGRVTGVKVLKPLPFGLDDAAVDAVRQWRFSPATLQGRPVPVYFRLTVRFEVH